MATCREIRGRRSRRAPRPLSESERRTVEQYWPLARSQARSWSLSRPQEAGEFESAANFELIRAVAEFDPARNVALGTFLLRRIRDAMANVRRKLLRERLFWTEYGGGMGIAKVSGGDTAWAGLAVRDEFEAWMGRLPDRHAEVCRALYVEGRVQKEAADSLGLDRATVSRLHTEAMGILSRFLGARREKGEGQCWS